MVVQKLCCVSSSSEIRNSIISLPSTTARSSLLPLRLKKLARPDVVLVLLINDSSLATDVVTRERPIFWV